MILFDPITGKRERVNLASLSKSIGISYSTLCRARQKMSKLSSLNKYILEDEVKISTLKKLMADEEIQDECWVRINDSSFEVSNYGRYKRNGVFLLPHLNHSSCITAITKRGDVGKINTHYWPAKMFLGDPPGPDYVIYEKDGDIFNCRVENLYYEKKGNVYKTVCRNTKSKPVCVMNLEGKVIDAFKSLSSAATHCFTGHSNISKSIERSVPCVGYRFKYITMKEYYELKDMLNDEECLVCK